MAIDSSLGLGEHSRGQVDADDPPGLADCGGQDRKIDAGPAAEINDGVTGVQVEQLDRVLLQSASAQWSEDPCCGVVGRGEPVVESPGCGRPRTVSRDAAATAQIVTAARPALAQASRGCCMVILSMACDVG